MSDITLRDARASDAAAVARLLEEEGLEADFVPDQFLVADEEGKVVACGRLKPLAGGAHELASVAVAERLRGQGVGADLVATVLAQATGPVYALALAPGFFAKLGFRETAGTPEALREKAETVCASAGFVPMAWTPDERARVDAADGRLALPSAAPSADRGAVAATGGGCCAPRARRP